jgi:hypothetical protein
VLTVQSQVTVESLTGREVTDFLLDARDDRYQAWWPGIHLELHPVRSGHRADHVGDVLFMDEFIGSRRVRSVVEVVESVPGERVVWQARLRGRRLPVRLALEVRDDSGHVELIHTVTAGWSGRGAVLDPLWRLYFSRSFEQAMERHVRTEFRRLRDLLHGAPT